MRRLSIPAAVLIVIGFHSVCVPAAAAGEEAGVQVGDWVRVRLADPVTGETEGLRKTGRLLGIDEETLTLEISPSRPHAILEREHVRELEVRTHPGQRLKGALLGGGIGLGVGAGTGALLESGSDNSGDDDFGTLGTIAAAVLLGSVGAAVGAVAGALIAPGDQWQDVAEDRIELGLDRGVHQGTRLYLAVRF